VKNNNKCPTFTQWHIQGGTKEATDPPKAKKNGLLFVSDIKTTT